MSGKNNDLIWKTLIESEKDIAIILGSLANKLRLRILTSLLKGSLVFSELQKITGLGKTALAHHLTKLVETGLIKHTARGRYELRSDSVELLNAIGATYATSQRRQKLEAAKRADHIQRIHTARSMGSTMKEFEVHIVKLEPIRVASVRAISKTPENDSWEKMRAWAEPKGLLDDLEKHPVFGFNNPDPSPDCEEYGYEFWISVDPDIEPEGEIEIKDFEGGLYAVTTCNLYQEINSEFFLKYGYLESWKKLVDWVKSSKYKMGKHQCLEKAHDPRASEEDLILDLYVPIEE
ncbi:MAG: GyrI-like domain-containing protein [Candidatus Hodarchaeota archaeon]